MWDAEMLLMVLLMVAGVVLEEFFSGCGPRAQWTEESHKGVKSTCILWLID